MKFKQMIPAVDWFAVFEVDGKPDVDPLVGWVIWKVNGRDEVGGIITLDDGPFTDMAEEQENFRFYIHQRDMSQLDERFSLRSRE